MSARKLQLLNSTGLLSDSSGKDCRNVVFLPVIVRCRPPSSEILRDIDRHEGFAVCWTPKRAIMIPAIIEEREERSHVATEAITGKQVAVDGKARRT